MKYLLLLLFIFITNCAPVGNSVGVEDEFIEFIALYSKYKKEYTGTSYIGGVSVVFHELEYPMIGACATLNGHSRGYRIYIEPNYWNNPLVTDVERELLILHELGHCDLGYDHFDESSIMEPAAIDVDLYLNNKDYFLTQFFNGSTPEKK